MKAACVRFSEGACGERNHSVGGLIFCISATPHLGSLFPLFHGLVPGDTDQLLRVAGLQSKQFSHRGWEPSPPRTKHHPEILINRLDQQLIHCEYATMKRRMKTKLEWLCDGRYLDRALILPPRRAAVVRTRQPLYSSCHVSRDLVTVTRLYPDPGPSSLTVLVLGALPQCWDRWDSGDQRNG